MAYRDVAVFTMIVAVLDSDGKKLDRDETQFTSDVDQSTLPTKPLMQPDRPNYVPQLENL